MLFVEWGDVWLLLYCVRNVGCGRGCLVAKFCSYLDAKLIPFCLKLLWCPHDLAVQCESVPELLSLYLLGQSLRWGRREVEWTGC